MTQRTRTIEENLDILFGMAEAYKFFAKGNENLAREWLKKHNPKHPLLSPKEKE